MNKITQAERDRLTARAAELIRQHGRQRNKIVELLRQETKISRERAIRVYSRVILKLNRPHVP